MAQAAEQGGNHVLVTEEVHPVTHANGAGMETAGVAGIHVEDEVIPRAFGGRKLELVSREEMVNKIQAGGRHGLSRTLSSSVGQTP